LVMVDGNASRILSCFGKRFSSGKILSASTRPTGIAQYPRLMSRPEGLDSSPQAQADYFSASLLAFLDPLLIADLHRDPLSYPGLAAPPLFCTPFWHH
jgi:hypothetical protein